MPKVQPRKPSYGEQQQLKRLQQYAAKRNSKLRPDYKPNLNTIYRPPQSGYGAIVDWSKDND